MWPKEQRAARRPPDRALAGTAPQVIIARHTGKDEEVIRRDIERDKFLTAAEARDYGMIDEVLTVLKRGTERIPEVVSS